MFQRVRTFVHRTYSSSSQSYSFVFDIDGVLLKGPIALPSGQKTLHTLKDRGIPFILLTNGGGHHEVDRAKLLSQIIGLEISPEQIIQCHTPFQQHARRYKTPFIVGNPTCATIAKRYGFEDPINRIDMLRWNPSIWPLAHRVDQSLPVKDIPQRDIDSIFVFHDSDDWGTDAQIVVDCLVGNVGKDRDEEPPLFFSNPDFLWANDFTHPRFGQGAFLMLVEVLYKRLTGRKLKSASIGKPSRETYTFADGKLKELRGRMGLTEQSQVFMIGDNPESGKYEDTRRKLTPDIQGANNYGWETILVRTGVWNDGMTIGYMPGRIEDDVWKAVCRILNED